MRLVSFPFALIPLRSRAGRVALMGLLFCAGGGLDAGAQTNSWTGSVSGYWENPDWSLGVLPGTNQSILFTNAGWKALGIGLSTAQHFPQTLSVDSVTISSPADSFNTLLLNYSGTETPLVIGALNSPGSLIIGPGSALVMFSSALDVRNAIAIGGSQVGAFQVDGSFTESDGSDVTAVFLNVTGTYNLTNSILSGGNERVGADAIFNQQGGTNLGTLFLAIGGEYDLFDGTVGGEMQLRGGQFNQWGGAVSSSLRFQGGQYQLAGGSLSCGDLFIPESQPVGAYLVSSMLQTGGTNTAGAITIGLSVSGGYTLGGGVLNASSLTVNPSSTINDYVGNSSSQSGGYHTNGGIILRGAVGRYSHINPSSYNLSGGTLETPSISLDLSIVSQTGGTNRVGALSLGNGSSYFLSGGLLIVSNFIQTGGAIYSQIASIQQSGGTNDVIGSLSLGNGSTYGFSGGLLIADGIQVTGGAVFQHTGGSFAGIGAVTLGDGGWNEKTSGQQLGQLRLSAGTNSVLYLPSGPCALRFADSSAGSWSSGAKLTVQNWAGSLNGGGQQQFVCGNSGAGLSAQQVSQVQFYNPSGLATGTYPARILATGEIVPDALLFGYHNGQQFALYWGPGWTLQTTTNLAGQFIDLSNATSPYTNHFTDPLRFFRLRR